MHSRLLDHEIIFGQPLEVILLARWGSEDIYNMHSLFSGSPERFGSISSLCSELFLHPVCRHTLYPEGFNAFVMLAIVANAIFIVLEEEFRVDSRAELEWLIADVCFTVIFTVEFILKFRSLRCRYFRESWNILDFVLVITGIFSHGEGLPSWDICCLAACTSG